MRNSVFMAAALVLLLLLPSGCGGPPLSPPGHLRAQVQPLPVPFGGLLGAYGVARVRLSWEPSPALAGGGGGYRIIRISGERLDIRTEVGEVAGSETGVSLALLLPSDEPAHLFEVVAFDDEGRESAASASGLVRANRYPSGMALVHPLGTPMCAPAVPPTAVLNDRRGTLWVATDGGGLVARSDAGLRRWSSLDGLLDDRVTQLAEGRDGRLWVGTRGGLQVRSAEQWQAGWTEADGFARGGVESMDVDAAGNVWIVGGGGLWRVVGGRGAPELVDREGAVPTNTGNPLRDLELGAERAAWSTLVKRFGAVPVLREVRAGADGSVWLAASGGGLARRRPGGGWEVVAPVVAEGAVSGGNMALPGRVTGLAPGRGLDAWVSDAGAVFYFSATDGWRRMDLPLDLRDGEVWSLAGDGEGVAVAVVEGRPLRCSVGSGRCRNLQPIAGNQEQRVVRAVRSASSWWFLAEDGTIEQRRSLEDLGEPVGFACNDAAPAGDVSAVALGPDGSLWASDGSNLARYAGGAAGWRSQRLPAAVQGADVRDLAFDAAGNLFVATSRGVALRVASPAVWTSFSADLAFEDDSVRRLMVGPSGRVWSALSGRLEYLDTDAARMVSPLGSARGVEVLAAAVTPDGQVWVATADGLRRLRAQENALGDPVRAEGLPSRVEAMAAGAQGDLWVAGSGVVASVSVLGVNPLSHALPASWDGDPIAAMEEVATGRLAILSRSGRLVCVGESGVSERAALGGPKDNVTVRGLAVDEYGAGWVATSGKGLVLVPHLCR